jgi:hypothetical protein
MGSTKWHGLATMNRFALLGLLCLASCSSGYAYGRVIDLGKTKVVSVGVSLPSYKINNPHIDQSLWRTRAMRLRIAYFAPTTAIVDARLDYTEKCWDTLTKYGTYLHRCDYSPRVLAIIKGRANGYDYMCSTRDAHHFPSATICVPHIPFRDLAIEIRNRRIDNEKHRSE